MIFAPNVLKGTFGSGDPIYLNVRAILATPLVGDVYVVVVDPSQVIKPQVFVQTYVELPDTYFASVLPSATLPAGHYQGAFQVRLCRDENCSSQHPGSPVSLPYDLQVLQGTNLTPLARWPSVSDWQTFQGNTAHTGYVPVTLDPSKFSPRWSWRPSGYEIDLSPPVIANGLVYVSDSPSFSSTTTRKLTALRESDGAMQWQADFGPVHELNPPAVSGGKVFVATTEQDYNTFMWSFDAATGAQLSKTAFGAQWEHYYAPTIEGGVVYTDCGTGGGMCAFDLATGAQKWFAAQQQYDEWTPAVDQNYAYSYIGGVLSALVKSTGEVAFTITDPKWEWDTYSMYGSPVLGANGAVLAVSSGSIFHDNHLMSFNTPARSMNWSVPGRYGGNPVLAKGIVYAATILPDTEQPRLEARRESTGGLLWSWTLPLGEDSARYGQQGAYVDLLVTDNLLFVGTQLHVYALDLATHAPVWTYWRGGNMAISANGVLYIDSGGTVGAVNLK